MIFKYFRTGNEKSLSKKLYCLIDAIKIGPRQLGYRSY